MAVVPAGTIEDHHGMGIGGDLAADLAEMVIHGGGIADWHDQRRRFALHWADRAKHNHTLTRVPRACTARTRSNCNPRVAKTPLAPPRRPPGGADAGPTNSTLAGAAAGRCSTGCSRS